MNEEKHVKMERIKRKIIREPAPVQGARDSKEQ